MRSGYQRKLETPLMSPSEDLYLIVGRDIPYMVTILWAILHSLQSYHHLESPSPHLGASCPPSLLGETVNCLQLGLEDSARVRAES